MESPGLLEKLKDALGGWAIDLALATAGGLFLGAIGPFGSYFNGPFWQRALFQVACFWMGVLLFGGGIRAIARLRLPAAWTWAAVVAMVLVLMAPLAAAIVVLARAIWPFEVARLSLADWYCEGIVTALPVGVRGGTLMSGWRGAIFKGWTFVTQVTAGSGLPETPI